MQDTGCMMPDTGCMMDGELWMILGCVPCALSLEPYAFVRYRMQETGSGWMRGEKSELICGWNL